MKQTRDTSIGKITISENGGFIVSVEFGDGAGADSSPLLDEAFAQLNLYLQGVLRKFSLPLAPSGTDFMQSVWHAVLNIPYGETRSYKDIAVVVKNPNAMRAVGLANNRNPIPIFIPCHRVIGECGKLIGYGGGLGIKLKLLDIESNGMFSKRHPRAFKI